MTTIEAVEKLAEIAYLYSVLIECDAGPGGKMWQVALSDNHARKGRGKAGTLDCALRIALTDLNEHCGGQIKSYL